MSRPVPPFRRHPLRQALATVGLSALLLLPPLARALPPAGQSEVQRLVSEGKLAPALKLIDEQIPKAPKDMQAQLQFQRGVVLSMLNRKPEALEAFKKLVADNPNMAPAYNNMAVIYGAMSDYDNAKAALDKAIKISPEYATAYQNLGDVYVQLATLAYQKSMQLDKSDPTVAPKVALLRETLNAGAERPAAKAGALAAQPASASAAPALVVAAAPATAPAAAVTRPPLPTTTARPADGAGANVPADVTATVRGWATAWSNRDAAAYVGFYAPQFRGQNASHAAWERERTERITQRSRIKVDVADLVVSAIGDKAEVKFRQSYESDGPTETSLKTLNLARSAAGQWLITRETSGK